MSHLIFKKISTIMSELDAVGKDSRNAQQGFNFRSIDAVINELHPLLAKHGVFIVPEVIEEKREERSTKSGGVMTYALMKIRYTFCAEDGSSVSAIMIGEGSDTGDKASNKAQSIALKYACLQVFAIPTNDDKDPDSVSPEFAPRPIMQPGPDAFSRKPADANPANPANPGEYVITVGKKYKGMKLKQVSAKELDSFCKWIVTESNKSGKKPQGAMAEFLTMAEQYLNELDETAPPQNPKFDSSEDIQW